MVKIIIYPTIPIVLEENIYAFISIPCSFGTQDTRYHPVSCNLLSLQSE